MENSEIDELCAKCLLEIQKEIIRSCDIEKIMELVHQKVLELKNIAEKRAIDNIQRDFILIFSKGLQEVKEIFQEHLKYIEEPYNNIANDLVENFRILKPENLVNEDDWLLLMLDLQDLFKLTLYISYPRKFLEQLELIEKKMYFNNEIYHGKQK